MEFKNYHPFINLIYFICAIWFTLWFNEPALVAISAFCAFWYSVRAVGIKALRFNLCLMPFVVIGTLGFIWFNHFGVTVLGHNSSGNSITLEALALGFVYCIIIYALVMWIECIFAVITSDKLVYLFGRISPKLSLYFSITLRIFPEILGQWRKIGLARRGLTKSAWPLDLLKRLSACITWSIDRIMSSTVSMKSRGYTLKGRTAYSLYRFDNRDRILVVFVFFCLTIIFAGAALGTNWILYDPEIVMGKRTPVSIAVYVSYFIFLTMPIWLERAIYEGNRNR